MPWPWSAIIFLALLAAAGLRSTPGVLMVPWGQAFGWSRGTISFAAATGIFLFGLTGPFAAAAMQRFGIRATVMAALALMSLSSTASLFMTQPWQLMLTWGVVSGIGSGCVTNVLSATIVNRWFVTNRGLVMGLFAASTSTGTLIFLPALSAIAGMGRLEAGGDDAWRVALALLIPLVFFLCRNGPPMSARCRSAPMPIIPRRRPASDNPLQRRSARWREGLKNRDFWLLAGTFFVCGFTTNGLVGTHMIALCGDHGLDAVAAGGLLAIMGCSIWSAPPRGLADRPGRSAQIAVRLLRPARAVADLSALRRFHLSRPVAVRGVLWPGLDRHRAAHPGARQPRLRHRSAPRSCSAGSPPAIRSARPAAAFLAGLSRTASGSYLEAFVTAGFVAVVAAFLALMIGRKAPRTPLQWQLRPGKSCRPARTLFGIPNTVKPLK